ncbi:MAG: SLC13 family permease [Actinomycetota bacterium]
MIAEVLARTAPVLVFLVAITVVAELSERAGVFSAAARGAARLAGERVWRLWALVVVLATAATVVLSLDTTAVLLTPVVLALARQLRLPTGLLAMTTVWLANTASLLLPVSNLTNLLSLHRMQALGVGIGGFVRLTWLPALVSVLLTVVVLAVMFRSELRGSYAAPDRVAADDPVLLRVSAAVCLLLGPAFVTGIQVAYPASAAALLLVVLFLVRDRSALAWALLPWKIVLIVLVLFVGVQWLSDHGLAALLARAAGSGEGFVAYLRMAGVAALGANGVDNLPAYLALEPVADDSAPRLVALLIGVNVGPLITLWASLATLLWRERCRVNDVVVPWWRFALRGLVLVPLLLVACCGALTLTA